eukprot:3372786-Pleurochrysis_carterae.AAC.1
MPVGYLSKFLYAACPLGIQTHQLVRRVVKYEHAFEPKCYHLAFVCAKWEVHLASVLGSKCRWLSR